VVASTTASALVCIGGCQLIDPDFSATADGGGAMDGSAMDGPDSPGEPDAPGADSPHTDAPGTGDAPAMVDAGTCDADLMTDDSNCGRCGHSCSDGGCSMGRCTAVPVVTELIGDLAYANGLLYWPRPLADGGGGIMAYDLDSGVVYDLVDNLDFPSAIAVAPPYLVWAANGQIQRSMLDGGGVTSLATIPTENIYCIAVDASGNVLWVNDTAMELDKTSLTAGGGASAIPNAYNAGIGCVRADATGAVVVGANRLTLLPPSGGTSSFLNCGDPNSFAALVGTNAYCNSAGNGVYLVDLVNTPLMGTQLEAPLPSGEQVADISADTQGVYWSVTDDPNQGEIHGCSDPHCNGGAFVLGLSPYKFPNRLVVTPDAVYFNEASNSQIYRLWR
jgi:hypothetical protein